MVSNHVQSLEDRLGACLLNRTTRKLGLTEIGKANYGRGTQILAELGDADRAAGALHSTPRGTFPTLHRRVARPISPSAQCGTGTRTTAGA